MSDQLSRWIDSVVTSVYRDTRTATWPEKIDYDTPPTPTEKDHIKRRSKAAKTIAAHQKPGYFGKLTATGRKRSAKARTNRFWSEATGWVINPKKEVKKPRTHLYWPTDRWRSFVDQTTENLESVARVVRERRSSRAKWRRK
jgi:hypothetical protein